MSTGDPESVTMGDDADTDETIRFRAQTLINLIECKNRGTLSPRVAFEFDAALIAVARRLRCLCGDDPAKNREFLGDQ
jgi:hypothetical protein